MSSPHRPRFFATATLVALAGAVTGLAAAGNVGPFAALGASAPHTVAAQLPGPALRADSLYPAPTQPPAVHEEIVVPLPATARPAATAAPDDWPTGTPAPTSAPSPTATPCYDDCGGGGDG